MPGACAPDPGSKRRAESQCLSGATASKRLYAPCVRVVPRGSDARTGEGSEALGDCLDEHGRKLLRAFEDFKRETKSLVREGRIYQAVDLVRRGVTGAKLAALDGRRVRVLWPLDAAWYSGVVAVSKCGGPSTSCTVVYEDGTKEDVDFAKEKVRIALRPTESLDRSLLRCSLPTCDQAAACSLTDQGNLVWAKMKGYPPWPALVITNEEFEESSCQKLRSEKAVCFRFFGSYEYGQTLGLMASVDAAGEEEDEEARPNPDKPERFKFSSKPYDVWRWDTGVLLHFHLKYKSSRFRRAVAQAERYLSQNEVPDEMIPLYNDELLDDIEEDDCGVVVQKRGRCKSKSSLKAGPTNNFSRSFSVGSNLVVEDIGAIEAGDRRFHDEQYVYPLGYRSKRVVLSPAGEKVEVQCSIGRRPLEDGGGPSFTVAVGGTSSQEAASVTEDSAQRAWQRLEELGMARRQVYSGHKLFGYSLRRVQIVIERLPGMEWLDRYSPLDDESWKANADARRTGTLAEEVRRANAKWEAIAQCPRSLGFEPVPIEHPPNRCAVCYTDKETDVNQLIQCDSCRTLVHMGCYGIQAKLKPGELWLCRSCQLLSGDGDGKSKGAKDFCLGQDALAQWTSGSGPKPACALCPCHSKRQIMVRTSCGRWAHTTCAIWVPETTLKNGEVEGLNRIRPARLQLKCQLCKVERGPSIQCTADKKCYAAAHPLCARQAGWDMKISEDGKDGIKLDAVCLKCKKKRQQFERGERPKIVARDKTVEVCENGGSLGLVEYYRKLKGQGAGKAVPYVVSGARGVERRVRGVSVCCVPPECAPVAERLEWTRQTVLDRLAAARSAIHGYGVVARMAHKAGDFLIEYVGEEVRPSVADRREGSKEYKGKVGSGTYIMSVSEGNSIDATKAGNMAQLLNHSCEPNCFSREVGSGRVILAALRDIPAGEELTYDYRFSSAETLVCLCGSEKCRGTVNLREDVECNLV